MRKLRDYLVKICHSEHETNNWLQENADVEIVEIKFSATKIKSVYNPINLNYLQN
ncbi:hypothetical protein KHA80_06505 [Anaerobacillus sp. HL2]|nr:hypothetical protein KHA80_06505 [Anaerobacillus sp. HL2]